MLYAQSYAGALEYVVCCTAQRPDSSSSFEIGTNVSAAGPLLFGWWQLDARSQSESSLS